MNMITGTIPCEFFKIAYNLNTPSLSTIRATECHLDSYWILYKSLALKLIIMMGEEGVRVDS